MATEKAVITQSHLTDIANAIIAKGGASSPLLPSQMAAAIEAIPTGGIEPKINPLDYLPDARRILREFDYSPYATGIDNERDCVIILFYGKINFSRATNNLYSFTICCNGEFVFNDWNSKSRDYGEDGKVNWIIALIKPPTWQSFSITLGTEQRVLLAYSLVGDSHELRLGSSVFGFSDQWGIGAVRCPNANIYAPNANVVFNGDYQGRSCHGYCKCKTIEIVQNGYSNNSAEGRVLDFEHLRITSYTATPFTFNCRFWSHYPKTVDSIRSVTFVGFAIGSSEYNACPWPSFATFKDGEIVSGLAIGFNENTTENILTATFDAKLKDFYTEEEVAKIEAEFRNRNWEIAWQS